MASSEEIITEKKILKKSSLAKKKPLTSGVRRASAWHAKVMRPAR